MYGAFVIMDTDTVSFHQTKLFSGKNQIIQESVERGDMNGLRLYILKYMDTTVFTHKPPRPPTPRVPRLLIQRPLVETKNNNGSPPINIPGNST